MLFCPLTLTPYPQGEREDGFLKNERILEEEMMKVPWFVVAPTTTSTRTLKRRTVLLVLALLLIPMPSGWLEKQALLWSSSKSLAHMTTDPSH